MKTAKRLAGLLFALAMLLSIPGPAAWASTALLPGVSEEMTDPAFWTRNDADADTPLASPEEIEALNRQIVDTPACMMTDMRAEPAGQDAAALRRKIWASAFGDASAQMSAHYFDTEGKELSGTDLLALLDVSVDGTC